MMWYYANGGWSWLMGSAMVLFLGVIIVLTIVVVRTLSGSTQTGDLALETLRRRLASGEISREEFAKSKRALG